MSDYHYVGEFKKKHSFEKRLEESERVRSRYIDRIPIIVEQDKNSGLPLLDKRKYLVPDDMTIGQFMYVVRKRMKLGSENGIYLFFNNSLVPSATMLREVYESYRDPDQFLYVTVAAEKTFG